MAGESDYPGAREAVDYKGAGFSSNHRPMDRQDLVEYGAKKAGHEAENYAGKADQSLNHNAAQPAKDPWEDWEQSQSEQGIEFGAGFDDSGAAFEQAKEQALDLAQHMLEFFAELAAAISDFDITQMGADAASQLTYDADISSANKALQHHTEEARQEPETAAT